MEQLEVLNNIYKKLHEEKNLIVEYLEGEDFHLELGFYPFHSFLHNNEFYLEQYPIPVITVNHYLDIGVDVHQVFFEFKMLRESALLFDFNVFGEYKFEVYGADDYYDDYYLDGKIDEITANIENSNEVEVGISILIKKDNIVEETSNVISMLAGLML